MPSLAETRAAALQAAFVEAARRNEWGWIADAFYADYGREMRVGWEGWSFPIERYCTHGNQIITHWWNRGPGRRADGGYFQTPGVSFITVGEDGLFTYQLDLFDLAHQMHLCGELEDAGLLSPKLKENWVRPMKAKLIAMLSR